MLVCVGYVIYKNRPYRVYELGRLNKFKFSNFGPMDWSTLVERCKAVNIWKKGVFAK